MKALNISLNKLTRFAIVAIFLLPFLFFAYKFKFQVDFNFSEIWWALKNSVYQSTLAAFFVILLAVPMSFGLAAVRLPWRGFVSRLLLLPQILPVFFTVLIVFSVVKPFPIGSAGIILLFCVVNLGLATVLIHQAFAAKLASLAVTAEVFSITRFNFLNRVFLRLMYSDLLQIFFLVFVFCMSSFSIPLMAGDGRAVNLEILVFEKVFIEGNWAAGFSVSLIQTFLVFALSAVMLETDSTNTQASGYNHLEAAFLKWKPGILLIGAYLGIYVAGYLFGLFQSLKYLDFLKQYSGEIWSAFLFSAKALLCFAVVSSGLLYLWLWDYLKNKKFNPALNFVSLSTVVAGFAVYLFFPTSSDFDLVKIVFTAGVLFFVPLFKLFLQSSIEGLARQIRVAEVLGLSVKTIIFEIILRQIQGALMLWFSVLSIWFVSDYAVSRAVGIQTQTLGLLAQGFLSSYRMPAAYLMSVVIIAATLLFLFVFKVMIKAAYVTYKKFAL